MEVQSPVKISVLMPARNVEGYIDEAIQSVLAQKAVSFELLIGDDASTDRTWARIVNYRTDPRVRAWCFRVQQGAGRMGNRLIERARGAYVSSCDSDDVMLPGHLVALSRVLDRSPQVGVACGDLLVLDERSGRQWIYQREKSTTGWDLLSHSLGNMGTLVRRSLMEKVGGYRSELPFLEDVDLFLRLAEVTQFHFYPGKPLYLYRKRPGALSNQPRRAWVAVGRRIWRETIFRRHGFRVPWLGEGDMRQAR